MRRRDLLILVGGAALWPAAASAQARHRLGVLVYGKPSTDPNEQSFRRAIRDLGYEDGQKVVVEYRYAEGKPERLQELTAELVRSKPDVLFALGGDVAEVAVSTTRAIPLVFVSSADPVKLGFVNSLSRPGGNATGVCLLLDETASKRLELLKETAPQISNVAFLYNPAHIDNELLEAERAAPALGLQLKALPLRSPDDIHKVFAAATEARADALYVVSSRQTLQVIDPIAAFAIEKKLPLAGGFGRWAQAGALLSYGPNVDDMVRRAAKYVDDILKGTKPADLPVQQPTRFDLTINLKTAKSLGLTVPESVLARADQAIE